MLKISQLYFEYNHRPIIKNLSLELAAGEIMHIQGANGSGKTTLLKLIAGLIAPTSGKIHAASCHYIGHKTGVTAGLSVREFIYYHWSGYNLDFAKIVSNFNLQGWEDILCGQLSVGLRKRLGLVGLLVSKAKIWLLDEPFVGLDATSIQVLEELISCHIQNQGKVILTSHQALPASILPNKIWML